MCGICGFLGQGVLSPGQPSEALLDSMLLRLGRRGPDDRASWFDNARAVGLGHTRLSIVDLSPAGRQPMASASGRYFIVFNGEIYNHRQLRQDLSQAASPPWRGGSDTETFLALLERHGLEQSLARSVGMFAMAVWDTAEQALYLVRDRFGEKPLYYALTRKGLLFASQPGALLSLNGFRPDMDPDAVALYFQYNYVPAPHSIYRGVSKLMPGQWRRFDLDTDGHVCAREPREYWSASKTALESLAQPFTCSEEEAFEAVHALALEVVADQMQADVPLGAFLSGGIDSSCVTSLMCAASKGTVKTFTIGFREKRYDESGHARAVARHLGTEHHELVVTMEQARDSVLHMADVYDEPFADSSQLPTWLLARLTRRHVTVCLSGDAGDEIFGGYNRYLFAQKLWRGLCRVPCPVRRTLSRAAQGLPETFWQALGSLPLIGSRMSQPADKLRKLATLLDSPRQDALYLRLLSNWHYQKCFGPALRGHGGVDHRMTDVLALDDFVERMMLTDTVTYLPDDILVKVDRATMHASLESRTPFLDHRLFALAWRLPLAFKVREGVGKRPLRAILDRYVPRRIIDRPKMGFGLPVAAWLRGPLRPWAEELLSEKNLAEGGLLDSGHIREIWRQHVSGQRNWGYMLWCVLMFQAWRQRLGKA